jgi:hypothetical protein
VDTSRTAPDNLELTRRCGINSKTGIVKHGPYRGQDYEIVASKRGFPHWYRVILTDDCGHVAERDIRESFL